MYKHPRLPKSLSCILAVAIAAQPMTGFSCGCDSVQNPTGRRSVTKRACCCGGSAHGRCGCCGSAHRSVDTDKLASSCCRQGAERDRTPSSGHICTCGSASGDSATPPSTPSQRTHTDDLVVSSQCGQLAVVDLPTAPQERSGSSHWADFASASAHCIALCRLRF